jgi:hypothetical protein
MKKLIPLALLAGLAFVSTACGLKMTRGDFQGPLGQANDTVVKAQADLALKKSFYNDIVKRSSTPKAVPYPEMGALVAKMDQLFPKAVAVNKELIAASREFDKLAEGRPDITSDRPQWEPFTKLYDKTKLQIPQLQEQLKAYAEASNRFASLANDNGISKINVADIRGQLAGQTAAIEKATGEIRNQVNSLEAKLKENTAMTLGLQQHTERHAILDDIRAQAQKLDLASASLKGKVQAFNDSTKGLTELWRGPGFPKILIVEQVAADSNVINGIVAKINADTSKWNSMN